MTKTIKFIGVNNIFEPLRDKIIECSIYFVGNKPPYEGTNMHEIWSDDGDYLLDIKGCIIDNGVVVHGILQDGEKVGKAAIQIF